VEEPTNGSAPSAFTASHLAVNADGWSFLAAHNCDSSVPYGSTQLENAVTLLDPRGWLPWDEIDTVLCLASAGGQQAIAFATLGRSVTLADLSPGQLAVDTWMAEELDLDVEILRADMLALERLHGRGFDLVDQPISACYVPDVERLYREVARTLRVGGYYLVEHLNSTQVQLDEELPWDGTAYRIVRPVQAPEPVRLPWWLTDRDGHDISVPLDHFTHSLDHLLGGLTRAGFEILQFSERTLGDPDAPAGSFRHQCAHLPPYFSLLARLSREPDPWW
jgi:SAM-dependent methyltransferase